MAVSGLELRSLGAGVGSPGVLGEQRRSDHCFCPCGGFAGGALGAGRWSGRALGALALHAPVSAAWSPWVCLLGRAPEPSCGLIGPFVRADLACLPWRPVPHSAPSLGVGARSLMRNMRPSV